MKDRVLEAVSLAKGFSQGGHRLEILNGLQLSILQGESVAILGRSGSGKSTLLSLLAGFDHPDSGAVRVLGRDLRTLSEEEMLKMRNESIGMVFQQFHLFPELTALENVATVLEIRGSRDTRSAAREILSSVGLGQRLDHFPEQLSGGERQRVAIARALVGKPRLIFADEPSGNLDATTGKEVMDLLFSIVKRDRLSMVLVTHDQTLAQLCDRQLVLQGGRLSE